jgi:hypothetical protein
MKVRTGNDFKDPRNAFKNDSDRGGIYVSQRTSEQTGIPQNVFTIPYLLFAYNVKRTTFQRKLKKHTLTREYIVTSPLPLPMPLPLPLPLTLLLPLPLPDDKN